jgi:flagellar basal body-associated protein FliL
MIKHYKSDDEDDDEYEEEHFGTNSQSPLSGEQIAGIVIGIVIFLALIALGAYYWFVIRPKNKQKKNITKRIEEYDKILSDIITCNKIIDITDKTDCLNKVGEKRISYVTNDRQLLQKDPKWYGPNGYATSNTKLDISL